LIDVFKTSQLQDGNMISDLIIYTVLKEEIPKDVGVFIFDSFVMKCLRYQARPNIIQRPTAMIDWSSTKKV